MTVRRAAACLLARASTSASASTSCTVIPLHSGAAFRNAVGAASRIAGAGRGERERVVASASRFFTKTVHDGVGVRSRVPSALDTARAFASTSRPNCFRASGGTSRSAATANASPPLAKTVAPVSSDDLKKIFLFNGVPFIAFGFVDNTVLIYAGEAIDASVGVTFGISSLAAAAMGQIFSDTSGVLFGSSIENAALRLGFRLPRLLPEQLILQSVTLASTSGKVLGVITGCCLGLVNLFFVDTLSVEKKKEEKEFTAIFKNIMHRGHEVAECAAAALWIVDHDTKTLWTRAAHGNKKSDLLVRRGFGVGIVGAVAETGVLSNVCEAYSHPRFDKSVDKDGITGFKSKSLLTAPVFDADGVVVAVVQLVNKIPKHERDARRVTTASSSNVTPAPSTWRRDTQAEVNKKAELNKKTVRVPVNDSGVTQDGGITTDLDDDSSSRWDDGWVPVGVTKKIMSTIRKTHRSEWWRRAFGSRKVGFDGTDEKLIRLMCHHVSVSLAAMEHKLPTE